MIRIEAVRDASCRGCTATDDVLAVSAQPEGQTIGHTIWLCNTCLGVMISGVLDNLMGKGAWAILTPYDAEDLGLAEMRPKVVVVGEAQTGPQTPVEGSAEVAAYDFAGMSDMELVSMQFALTEGKDPSDITCRLAVLEELVKRGEARPPEVADVG